MVDPVNQVHSALLRYGHKRLEELWEVSASQVSKRLSSEQGIPLDDAVRAMDAAGIEFITDGEHVIIHKDELVSLRTLGAMYLASKADG